MAIDVTNFLLSLGFEMATLTGKTLGTDIFVLDVTEQDAASPFAVLRPYGGPAPDELEIVEQISIQCMIQAKVIRDGLAFAQVLYESLKGDDGAVRNYWDIAGKVIAGDGTIADDVAGWHIRLIALAGPPGQIGRDDQDRTQIVFNFDARFDFLG